MDDFQKKVEEARRARMQGIMPRTGMNTGPQPMAPMPKKNRIEEALGNTNPKSQIPNPKVETFMPIPERKVEEKIVTEAPKSTGEKKTKTGGYSGFLRRFFLGLAVLVLVVAVGFGGYTAFKVYKQPPLTADGVIVAVGKLVELPQGEKPTVATISDLKPLAGQEFFKDAAVGDKVLIFGDTKKAILYRPSANKIIQIAPLNK